MGTGMGVGMGMGTGTGECMCMYAHLREVDHVHVQSIHAVFLQSG